jgi:hypothetical protein
MPAPRPATIEHRRERAYNLARARTFCVELGYRGRMTRQWVADKLEDFLQWEHDYSKPSTTRIALAMDQLRKDEVINLNPGDRLRIRSNGKRRRRAW